MDFFEAQARAKRRTTRLVALFVLAVLGTIAAGYVTTLALLALLGPDRAVYLDGNYAGLDPWQPAVLGWVALGTTLVVGLASLHKWAALRGGGAAVAETLGGRRIAPNTTDRRERQLLNVVEEMAIASGTPVPAVYLLEAEKGINAFAAGLTPSDAVVAVTRGTLDRLSRDELQGVIAHEFSHILNGDMRLNLRLTSIVFGILALALLGRMLLHSLRFARVTGSGRGRKSNAGGILLALLAVGLALLLIGYIGYFFGRLIQAAVSRQREYLADASAVQFTRHPGGIVGALRKIGGLALGARLAHPAAAQFHHTFFAQAFASFTGLFATHPRLAERIRAIDPGFDGTFVEPPQVVDVARESFRTAGFGPVQAERLRREPPPVPPAPTVAAAVRSVGLPTPAHLEHSRALLAALPPAWLDAARDSVRAPALVYALLLEDDPAGRERQLALVSAHDPAGAERLRDLLPLRAAVGVEARLPLLQVAIGSLRQFTPAELDRFLGTLDELVHADAQVTTFEFALQKMLTHHLHLARRPDGAGAQLHSFAAVAPALGLVLSTLAHTAADASDAAAAFARGAAALRMLDRPLELQPRAACTFAALEAALDRLALAAPPIKRRLIEAGAQVVAADGTLGPAEAELLRAICAALDCPMPPLI